MARAKKCDRCGFCFDPLAQGDALMAMFQNPNLRSSTSLMDCKIERRLLPNAGPDEWVDLCPVCTTDFLIFMHDPSVGTRVENKDDNG